MATSFSAQSGRKWYKKKKTGADRKNDKNDITVSRKKKNKRVQSEHREAPDGCLERTFYQEVCLTAPVSHSKSHKGRL